MSRRLLGSFCGGVREPRGTLQRRPGARRVASGPMTDAVEVMRMWRTARSSRLRARANGGGESACRRVLVDEILAQHVSNE